MPSFIIIIVAAVTGFIGFVIGGIVEEILWSVGDFTIETTSECEKLKNKWEDTCEQNKSNYYSGQYALRILGFFAPFLIVLKNFGFLKR